MDVRRPKSAKVAVVESGDLGLAPALSESEDRCVNHPDPEITVVVLHDPTTTEVGVCRRLNRIGTSQNVLQEQQPRIRVQAPVAPVVEFGQNERRYHQRLVGLANELGARGVVWVRGVERGEERPGVKNQGHGTFAIAAARPRGPRRGRRRAGRPSIDPCPVGDDETCEVLSPSR
jgi:hypothetical protein